MAVKQSTTKPAVKEQTKVVAAKTEALGTVTIEASLKPAEPIGVATKATEGEDIALVKEENEPQAKNPVAMQAIEDGLKGKSGITVKQNIVVQGDSMVLVQAFQTAVIRGARLIGEFPQLNNFPKFIKLQVELDLSDDEWENDVPNGLHCSPVAAKDMIYDKETMDALPWETFRKVVNKHGVQGRDRKVMLNEYLKKTEQA